MNLACFTSFQPNPITIDSIGVSTEESIAAVGLSNGSIRLHDLESFAVKAAIPGHPSRSVRRILFHEGKMITSGIHGSVSMWDLGTCTEMVSLESSQGAIWDMVLSNNTLYLATETGAVVLVDIRNEDLRISGYWRSSSSSKTTRALAVCIEGESLFVGDSSGSISRWNMASGVCDSTFSIQSKGTLPPLIWSMVGLGNGTFATGDSLGTLSIWDATSSTLIRSRQDHQADILIMAKSHKANELYTSGVDSRLVRYRIDADQNIHMLAVGTVIQRDISAIACIEGNRKNLLVGGADGRVGYVSIPTTSTSIPSAIKLHRFYSSDIRVVASGSERIFCQENSSKISIYQTPDTMSQAAKLIGEIDNGSDSIATFAVDNDGSRIVVSGVSGTCRVLVISDSISQQSKFKISSGIATSAAVSNKMVLVGTSTGSVFSVDLRKSEPVELLPASSPIKNLFLDESSSKATIVSVGGQIYSVNLAARKRKEDAIKIFESGSIITAVSRTMVNEDSSVIVATADHRVIGVCTTTGSEQWSLTIPKKFKGFANCHHISWIEFDANVLTLFSESCMFTVELPGTFAEGPQGNDPKLHSMAPLGGIAIGAGRLGVSEQTPKKQRRSAQPTKPVLLAINSYKAIHNQLVDQFERKSFQSRR